MPLSKEQIAKSIRLRRYAVLYRYIDMLKFLAYKRKWTYGRTHSGYDAAAIPPNVYKHWWSRYLETHNPILYCEEKDAEWLLLALT